MAYDFFARLVILNFGRRLLWSSKARIDHAASLAQNVPVTYVCLLPPANGVAKVLFSVISVHQLFCPWGKGESLYRNPALIPSSFQGPNPLNIFKLAHYEEQTVRKRLVGIRLKCLLVLDIIKQYKYTYGESFKVSCLRCFDERKIILQLAYLL